MFIGNGARAGIQAPKQLAQNASSPSGSVGLRLRRPDLIGQGSKRVMQCVSLVCDPIAPGSG